ncbi:hypothetical protein FB45DRAFT_1033443 [Roridomyces roridus]|uniref:F-box domain-containing protein n=1 Tax=Roridomyces roridus TaxID=1738132 RepID=A0AAD7BFD5_9AGAR|nr:hypothetical protein FB45DRAFT_1033443 [Roridomyces roridus]
MPTFHDLPPKLVLEVVPHLPLKALIAAEGVYRQWKAFVSIAAYLTQHDYIPEDFRLWILEWPNKAVIACAWPGLPAVYCWEDADDVERVAGYNHLGCIEVYKITAPDGCSDGKGDRESYFASLGLSDEDWYSEVEEDAQVPEADKYPKVEESGTLEFTHPKGYYLIQEVFGYLLPPGLSRAQRKKRFPTILIWEKDSVGQTWLVLSPESPFAVFHFPNNRGEYQEYITYQYPTWITWLEAQLRWMHRAADWRPEITGCEPSFDDQGSVIDPNVWFHQQGRRAPLWSEEDEAEYRLVQADA